MVQKQIKMAASFIIKWSEYDCMIAMNQNGCQVVQNNVAAKFAESLMIFYQ